MNKILYFGMACCLSILSSCVEDTGNYDYLSKDEVIPVKIIGLEDKIEVIQGQQFNLTPELTGITKEANYRFSWWAVPTDLSGYTPKSIILGTSKELNQTIKLDVGSYSLYFEVRDTEKDIYVNKQMRLMVTASSLNTGWYVLKDKNNETDFDYINLKGEMHANILAAGNNQLKGKAREIAYQNGGYKQIQTSETGELTTLVNQKVFHIISSEDFRTFNAQNLALFKTFNDHFYAPPAKCNPQCVWSPKANISGSIYLMNAGKLHSISGISSNAGKLGAARLGEYVLYPRLMQNTYSGNMLVFDEKSRSFFQTSPGATALSEIPSQTVNDSIIHMKQMDYSMVDFFSSEDEYQGTQQGFALMRSIKGGTCRLCEIPYEKPTFLRSFHQVDPGSLLMQASVRTCASTGNFIYFAIDNKVYYYMNAPELKQKEQLLVTLPAGETVSYMRYVFSTSDMKVLAVLANTPSHWKLYLYKVEATGNPELEPEPVATYTGEGAGRFIMYRAL